MLSILLLLAIEQAPDLAADTSRTKQLDPVVVTATRTERHVGSLPMPVTLIGQQQIRQSGSLRLNDILREQTGLAIVNDHGQGLQVQGFGPDYTLILVDGEPLVGRTAGTLELSRLTVGNIRQIEVVKGPSSSLYGSEALAGVVNIITANPAEGVRGSLSSRYGANQTSDLTTDISLRSGKTGLYLFGNRYQSGGYDLSPETPGTTVSPFLNYTTSGRLTTSFGPRLKLGISGRFFTEQQDNSLATVDQRLVSGTGRVRDYSINPVLTQQLTDTWKLTYRYYHTGYHTTTKLAYQDTQAPYDDSYFRQNFDRVEIVTERTVRNRHYLTLGAGYIGEGVEATRYPGRQQFSTRYGLAQFEWQPSTRLTLIAGGRFDAHSQYASQFSPKLSARYELNQGLAIRASAGVGFKAPDFRQLYLNFDNAVAGYSVFGTQEVAAGIARLQQQGQIAEVLIDPGRFGAIRAESSVAVNLGAVLDLRKAHDIPVRISANLFRNDIRDLIETQVVARKTNGQNVFSYTNLSRVYTQGIELDGSYRIELGGSQLTISSGYQLLEAKDKAVVSSIRNGDVFRRNPETLLTERVNRSDYGGLLNRSRHMANVKLFYELTKSGVSASLRGIYRSRYGLADRNGNLILDEASEYVRGYTTWHLTAAKTIKKLTLQAGVDNLTGYTDPSSIPTLAGQLWYASLRWDWAIRKSKSN
ncbi:outer membrane receptor for ferrienterochelin and colicins [Spirosoma lacussanchae]|uniref:TonB-dependent receptor plug domain-containing protein n=1 Tax=Spirosoma lacussanchae TaxID=1884249 RepID=UPI001109A29C|nr:TonB-dependent receptor [Spirosoma lacussanchae]